MDTNWDIGRVLKLRKLTRVVGEYLATYLREQLSALGPLFAPRLLLGEFIRSDVKQTVKGAEQAFKELQGLYQSIARLKPYSLLEDLKTPLDVFGASVEIGVSEYPHAAQAGGDHKTVTVTSPFKWVLTYKDLGPRRLRELLVSPSGSAKDDLQIAVLHYVILHLVLSKRPGVGTVLEALRFPVSSIQYADLGTLPVASIAAPIATVLPPDDIVMQSVELSGASAFEEVIDLGRIGQLADPIRNQLVELIRTHDESLLREIS